MSDSNNKNFKLNKLIIVIFVVLFILSIMLMSTVSFEDGYIHQKSNKNIQTYDTIEDLISKSSLASRLQLEIPSYLTDLIENTDELQIRVTLGSIIELGYSDYYVLKMASFVDNNADTLGLYEKSIIDNKYNVQNSDTGIVFFRYRADYPEYPNCTFINWCTNIASYGLMLGGLYTEQEAIEIVFGNPNIITLQSVDNTQEIELTEIESNLEQYVLGGILTVNLPEDTNKILIQSDLDGFTTFYINKTLCFVFVYNDYDIDNNTFEGQTELKINETLSLYYRSENPFNKNTDAYNYYNNFIDNLSIISDSIGYIQ